MKKPTKWPVRPANTQISLGIRPVWSRVFAVRMKKAWVLSYPLGTQWRLIRLGRCPGWSESSLSTHAVLLVLSCCGSYYKCWIASKIIFSNGPGRANTCRMPYANNKGVDQPAHLRSLTSAYVVRPLDSIISLVSRFEISRF